MPFGTDENIIQEWIIKTGQAVQSVDELAKKIRAEQAHEKKLDLIRAELDKTTKAVASSEANWASALKNTAGTMALSFAKGTLLAGAISTVKDMLLDAVKATHEYSMASTNFRGDLEGAREATQGLASDLDLMQAKNKLAVLGVQLSGEEYNKLLASLTKISGAMGIELSFAIESATTMLARQSTAVADNVGVVISAESAQKKYAESIGKTSSQLTDAEKKIAFQREALDQLNRKAGELGPRVETLTGQVKQLGVAFTNAATAAASWVNITFGGQVNEAMKRFQSNVELTKWWINSLINDYPRLASMLSGGTSRVLQQAEAVRKMHAMAGLGEAPVIPITAAPAISGKSPVEKTPKRITAAVGAKGKILQFPKAPAAPSIEETQAAIDAMLQSTPDMSAAAAGILSIADAWKKTQTATEDAARASQQYAAIQATTSDVVAMGTEALKSMAGSLWTAADAAIQGSETLGMAIAKSLKSVLLAVAVEATVKGMMKMADYVASWGMDMAALTSAGMYFATAAVAGAAGLGISAGIGAAGGYSSGSPSSQSPSASSTPSFGTTTQPSAPTIVNVYLGDPKSKSALLLATKTIQAAAA